MDLKTKSFEDAERELCSSLLSDPEKKEKPARFQFLYQKCDNSVLFLYSKLVLSQFCWRGASLETIHSLIPRVKKILLVDLQFSCVEDVIDELCVNLAEPDNTITYTAIFTDTALNKQFVVELLVTSVLANTYDAIMRSFLCRVIGCISIPLHSLLSLEQSLLSTLVLLADHLSKDTDQIAKETKKVSKRGKWLKVGAAAAAGSLLVLAAPALIPAASTLLTSLAGISTILGGAAALSAALSATAAFLSTSAGVAVFSAGVLAGGAGYAGNKMRRRLSGDVDGAIVATGAESPVRDSFDVFFVNGYLTGDETALQSWGFHPTNRWMGSFACGRAYVVDWESELLRGLSSLFVDTAVQAAASSLVTRSVNSTLLRGTLVTTPAMVAMMPLAYLDNRWAVARSKAASLGVVIAEQIDAAGSSRPVSFVGYSVGCCVILAALRWLAERKRVGRVEDVILLGCPAPSDAAFWQPLRAVVSGRLVNGFSRQDGVLRYLHRIEAGELAVAGLEAIAVEGVENVDLSEVVEGHGDYERKLRVVLERKT
ncbi:hypothetical protein WA588_003703 [Blastocystis sp. NMH]